MVSVPQNSYSCGPTSAVFGGSTVINCYYAIYSGNISATSNWRIFLFMLKFIVSNI